MNVCKNVVESWCVWHELMRWCEVCLVYDGVGRVSSMTELVVTLGSCSDQSGPLPSLLVICPCQTLSPGDRHSAFKSSFPHLSFPKELVPSVRHMPSNFGNTVCAKLESQSSNPLQSWTVCCSAVIRVSQFNSLASNDHKGYKKSFVPVWSNTKSLMTTQQLPLSCPPTHDPHPEIGSQNQRATQPPTGVMPAK